MRFNDPFSFKTKGIPSDVALDSILCEQSRLDLIRKEMETNEGIGSIIEAALIEKLWRTINRPYYNVFPVVTELVENISLDLNFAHIKPLRFYPLSIRFPVGHEPHGIQAVTIYSAPTVMSSQLYNRYPELRPIRDGGLLDYMGTERADWVDRYWECVQEFKKDKENSKASECSSVERISRESFEVRSLPTEPMHEVSRQVDRELSIVPFSTVTTYRYPGETETRFVSDHFVPKQIEHATATIEEILDHWYGEDKDLNAEDRQSGVRTKFVMRLYSFLSLLTQGNDLITPALLNRDADRYQSADEMARRKMEERASNLNGTGFNVGKELQKQTDQGERSPHYRRPHAAIIRCGKKWQERKLIVRAGCVVTPKHLCDVPTGFLGPETQAEIDAPEVVQKKYQRPNIPKRMRFNVLRRDGFACRYCGLSRSNCEGVVLHADHIISVNDGGSTTVDNLITACDCCNLGKWKDSLSPEEIQQNCEQFSFDNKHPNRIKNKRRAKQHTSH